MPVSKPIDLDPPRTLSNALSALDNAAAEVIALVQSSPGYVATSHMAHAGLHAIATAVQDLRVSLRNA